MRENLKSVKKLNELQGADYEILSQKYNEKRKEVSMLQDEIKLVENENQRIIYENVRISKPF